MNPYTVTIGLAPIRRDVSKRPADAPFSWEVAEERAETNLALLTARFAGTHVRFVRPKGLLYNLETAEAFAEFFKKEKIDALFLINCNFGNEEAGAELAHALQKPTLIWAPLDESFPESGVRTTDSQCGLFGLSRQLQRLGVTFSHLPTCRVESAEFAEGFERFVRVACMVKHFRGMRIGQVGCRPAPFYSVICNEGELLERFGIRIIPVSFAVLGQKMEAAPRLYPDEIARFRSYFEKNFTMDEASGAQLDKMAALAAVYVHLFEDLKLDVLSAECWTATPAMFDGLAPCAVNGLLADLGYFVSCESDIMSAVTARLLKSATLGEGIPLMGEFTVRHPENKNAELLWHCGPFPLSQKAADSPARLVNQRQNFRVKDGTYTAARLDRGAQGYELLSLLCRTTDGPATGGTYFWGEFEDLQAVEDRLLQGPYIHHFVEIEGDFRRELAEFCRYVPEIRPDTV